MRYVRRFLVSGLWLLHGVLDLGERAFSEMGRWIMCVILETPEGQTDLFGRPLKKKETSAESVERIASEIVDELPRHEVEDDIKVRRRLAEQLRRTGAEWDAERQEAVAAAMERLLQRDDEKAASSQSAVLERK